MVSGLDYNNNDDDDDDNAWAKKYIDRQVHKGAYVDYYDDETQHDNLTCHDDSDVMKH